MIKTNQINDEIIFKMEELLSIASDSTRLKIMFALLDDSKCTCDPSCNCGSCKMLHCMIEKNVSEIMNATGCSQSLVSHQLKVLKDADLVETRKEGTKVFYSLKDGHVRQLLKVVYSHVMEEE